MNNMSIQTILLLLQYRSELGVVVRHEAIKIEQIHLISACLEKKTPQPL